MMGALEADEAIDHETLDWSGVVAATYAIEQSIRYDYRSPITNLRHRLVISPRAIHGDQRRGIHDLSVTPPARVRVSTDAFGNEVGVLNVARVERNLTFSLRSIVVRDARFGAHVADPHEYADPALRGDGSRLTRLDDALRDAAAGLRARYANPHELAEAIVGFVHREMNYTKNVTDVFTTAAVAFDMRRGVCQDYAHVTLALARACGLAARYVSGHLLGEGATHAWIEILIPAGDHVRVLAFDPTTGRHTNWRYIVVAVGRDYEDVAPTSGVFTGDNAGSIGGHQAVRVTGVTLAA